MAADQDRYAGMTRDELYSLAQEREIEGRAEFDKEDLIAALRRDDELEAAGPEAVAMLTEQHDEIKRLFAEFDERSSRPSRRKDEIVREMITLLVKHSEIEEQVLYPAIREELEGQADQVDESLEEHHAAELLLWELDHMTSEADRFDAKVTVLKENVLHHIAEEEDELFPRVLEAMSEDRRREVGTAMEQVWRIAPSRPHPLTPDTPPGNRLAAIPGTVIDLTVGAARGVGRFVRRG